MYHSQEDVAKFGYRSIKKLEKTRNPVAGVTQPHDSTNSGWDELKFIPIIGSTTGIEVGSILFSFPLLTSRLPTKKNYSTAQSISNPNYLTFAPSKTLNLVVSQEQKQCCKRRCYRSNVEVLLQKTMLHRHVEAMLQKWCWSGVAKDVVEVVLQKTLLQKITSASVASKCIWTFFFICFFFTLVFLLRCSRWWRACLACRHLLHLRKKQKNDDEPSGLPSSTTPEKKNKEITTSRGGSPSSATLEKKKNKEMTMSQGGSSSSATPEKKCRRWRWVGRLPTRCHLLGFFSTVSSRTTSPPDASPGFLWSHWLHHHLMHLLGFYDLVEISLTTSPPNASPGFLWSHWNLTDCITTWCISWDFVISLTASPPNASPGFCDFANCITTWCIS